MDIFDSLVDELIYYEDRYLDTHYHIYSLLQWNNDRLYSEYFYSLDRFKTVRRFDVIWKVSGDILSHIELNYSIKVGPYSHTKLLIREYRPEIKKYLENYGNKK